MADSVELLHGARYATPEDAQFAYDTFSARAKARGYVVGITGSTLFGEGQDVDLIVVSSVDATDSAAQVANEFISNASHVYFYEEDENGSSAAAVFLQNGIVIDAYFYGLER